MPSAVFEDAPWWEGMNLRRRRVDTGKVFTTGGWTIRGK
jgi:hypothetical protein